MKKILFCILIFMISYAQDHIPADTVKKTITADTLNIIGFPDSYRNTVISRQTFERSIFESVYDGLNLLKNSFVKRRGMPGQPVDLEFSGFGNNHINFSENNVLRNNRFSNSINLFSSQLEKADSIFVSGNYNGFYYGENNQVSVNIITRTSIPETPITTLKYFQGPDNEGFIDAYMNVYLLPRLGFSFELTHQKVDEKYSNVNSSFNSPDRDNSSYWMGNIKLRYLFSEGINILSNFKIADTKLNITQGLPWDSDTDIYSETPPGPVTDSTYSKEYQIYYDIKTLLMFGKNIADLTFYYQTNLEEFRQFETGSVNNPLRQIYDYKYSTYGISSILPIKIGLLDFELTGRIERTVFGITKNGLKNEKTLGTASFGARTTLNIIPGYLNIGGYIKYINQYEKSHPGIGADIKIKFNDVMEFYAGMSNYLKPFNFYEYDFSLNNALENTLSTTIEAGINYSGKDFKSNLSVNLFKLDDMIFAYADTEKDLGRYNVAGFFNKSINYFSASAVNEYSTGDFLFRLKLNAIISGKQELGNIGKYEIKAGIYYKNILFDDALDLKAGLEFNFTDPGGLYTFDKIQSRAINFYMAGANLTPFNVTHNFNNNFTIDFVSSSGIKNSAIIYFAVYNLLDSKYFSVPYFPERARHLKIGVQWDFIN